MPHCHHIDVMSGPLDYESCISAIPTSFATVSIGSSDTPLPEKLSAIAAAGFKGIELGFPDLQTYAGALKGKDVAEDDFETLASTAQDVKKKCDDLGLKIMMLQPFANFEGWPSDSKERKEVFVRAKGWINIMTAAGCDMLQVGSSDSEGITLDRDQIAKDLAELADLLAEKGYRMAYENWCWSTHAPNWADVWDIVQRVNRPNVGLCLDTFQSAGGEWADPTTETGRTGDLPEDELEQRFMKSLNDLAQTVPKDKIYLLQLSDAYKPPKPLSKEKDESGLRPRGRWSHDFRPLPFDGGYLPIVPFTKAVLKTGFRGWFSMEVFDGGKDGKAEASSDLNGFAKKAMESYRRLVKEAAV